MDGNERDGARNLAADAERYRRSGQHASVTQVLLLQRGFLGQIVRSRRQRYLAAQHLADPPRLMPLVDHGWRARDTVGTPGVRDDHLLAVTRQLEQRDAIHPEEFADVREPARHVGVDFVLGQADEGLREIEKKLIE